MTQRHKSRPSARSTALRKWSAEEDLVLHDAVQDGLAWSEVAARLRDATGAARTPSACEQRWHALRARRQRAQLLLHESGPGALEVDVIVGGERIASVRTSRTLREVLAHLAEAP